MFIVPVSKYICLFGVCICFGVMFQISNQNPEMIEEKQLFSIRGYIYCSRFFFNS